MAIAAPEAFLGEGNKLVVVGFSPAKQDHVFNMMSRAGVDLGPMINEGGYIDLIRACSETPPLNDHLERRAIVQGLYQTVLKIPDTLKEKSGNYGVLSRQVGVVIEKSKKEQAETAKRKPAPGVEDTYEFLPQDVLTDILVNPNYPHNYRSRMGTLAVLLSLYPRRFAGTKQYDDKFWNNRHI